MLVLAPIGFLWGLARAGEGAPGPVNARLAEIASVFGLASILSFGGANTIVPQLQLATVDQHPWLTAAQFADCFAIGQVAPGPNTMLVTLIGYQAAGLPGALVATIAMAVPSCNPRFRGDAAVAAQRPRALARRAGARARPDRCRPRRGGRHHRRPRRRPQRALGWGVTIAAAALLAATKVNPLLVVVAGGLAGLALGGL